MLVLDDFLSDAVKKGAQWYNAGKKLIKGKSRQALRAVHGVISPYIHTIADILKQV